MTTEEKLAFKSAIREQCLTVMQERFRTIQAAMEEAQDSVNNEDKSTVGDKYEVARAMGHLQQEMLVEQRDKASDEIALISALHTEILCNIVTTGAVVVCSDYIFFIVVGLGTITVDGKKVTVLSPVAPLALSLFDKKSGDSFQMNKNTVQILDVF